MGRHPKDDFSRKCENLRIRLTPEEHAWLKIVAKDSNESMSSLLIRTFFDYVNCFGNEDIYEWNEQVQAEVKKNHGENIGPSLSQTKQLL